MTPPPTRAPECPRLRDVPAQSSRLVGLGLAMFALPLLAGAGGSIAFEAIGPLVTLTLWLALLVVRLVRARGGIYIFEWVPLVGCVITLQLLLDLHTPHLGDIVVGALHACVLVLGVILSRRAR